MASPFPTSARFGAFYAAALAPLGIAKLFEYGPDQTDSGATAIGFGKDMMPFFWIGDALRAAGTRVIDVRAVPLS